MVVYELVECCPDVLLEGDGVRSYGVIVYGNPLRYKPEWLKGLRRPYLLCESYQVLPGSFVGVVLWAGISATLASPSA